MAKPVTGRRVATYEDLRQVPEPLVAEIVDGELWTTPRPALPHARTASLLGIEIGGPFDQGRGGPGGWWILDEPEIHLDTDVLVPDLAGWRREHLTSFPHVAFMTLPPEWLCEVLSPATERRDRQQKLRIYARAGVGHVWLINPLSRTLEVLRLNGGTWLLAATFDGDAEVRAEPFDDVALPLSRVWPDLPPDL